jgi:hypothetical protein
MQPREAILGSLPFLRFLTPEQRSALFGPSSSLCKDVFVRWVGVRDWGGGD